MLVRNNDKRFWDYFDNFLDSIDFYPSLYEKNSLEYYKVRPLNNGCLIEDKSFIICENNNPVFIFLGSIINENNVKNLLANEISSTSFELGNISNASKTLIKNYFKKEIFLNVNNVLYKDYYDFKISFLSDFFVDHFSVKPKLCLSSVIFLNDDHDVIKRNYRKSYKSLINQCKREFEILVLDSENINDDYFWKFRDLHIKTAGRETRSKNSWEMQLKMIKMKNAFMVLGFNDKSELVTGGIFFYNKFHCYYGVGVSNRDMFDKPLLHGIMDEAILKSKNLGCNIFELGDREVSNDSIDPKLINISNFKKGFRGASKLSLEFKININ